MAARCAVQRVATASSTARRALLNILSTLPPPFSDRLISPFFAHADDFATQTPSPFHVCRANSARAPAEIYAVRKGSREAVERAMRAARQQRARGAGRHAQDIVSLRHQPDCFISSFHY
jgi:hypothetical protein